MYEPYSDNPLTSGFLSVSPETLRKDIPKYLERGWQVVSPVTPLHLACSDDFQNAHCIGDRANGIVLDVFEEALKGKAVELLRPRIEHAQIFKSGDLERVGKLGCEGFYLLCCNRTHSPDSNCQRTAQACHKRHGICRCSISMCWLALRFLVIVNNAFPRELV